MFEVCDTVREFEGVNSILSFLNKKIQSSRNHDVNIIFMEYPNCTLSEIKATSVSRKNRSTITAINKREGVVRTISIRGIMAVNARKVSVSVG